MVESQKRQIRLKVSGSDEKELQASFRTSLRKSQTSTSSASLNSSGSSDPNPAETPPAQLRSSARANGVANIGRLLIMSSRWLRSNAVSPEAQLTSSVSLEGSRGASRDQQRSPSAPQDPSIPPPVITSARSASSSPSTRFASSPQKQSRCPLPVGSASQSCHARCVP